LLMGALLQRLPFAILLKLALPIWASVLLGQTPHL